VGWQLDVDGGRRLAIRHCWDGTPAPVEAWIQLDVRLRDGDLEINFCAPYYGDEIPKGPRGRCPRLWEHEVVELFLLGENGRYLEIELGPHGHYLALLLHGRRNVVRDDLRLSPTIEIIGDHGGRSYWRAHLVVGQALIPRGWDRINAYAIHGGGVMERQYLAHAPTLGSVPDFHRLEIFVPIEGLERRA